MSDPFYYFFSTYAQSIAALVGLSVTFAIFKYQNFTSDLKEKSEKISQNMRHGDYKFLFATTQLNELRKRVNDYQRLKLLQEFLSDIFKDCNTEVKFKTQYPSDPTKYEEFMEWEMEFVDFNYVENKMLEFRKSTLLQVSRGLILIALSCVLIFTPNILSMIFSTECSIRTILLSLAIGVDLVFGVIYGKSLFNNFKIAFEIPATK